VPEPDTPPDPETLMRQVVGLIPHALALGIETVHATRGMAIMRLPYDERLIGNPENGVLHGGAVTTLIDTVCGLAAVSMPEVPKRVATLDLRIDYLRPATPKRPLFARAEVYKSTRQIAFLRASAYQDGPGDLVAAAAGTFMFVGPRPTGATSRS
jgi:uncharacterized protein (TIGR00369 family)